MRRALQKTKRAIRNLHGAQTRMHSMHGLRVWVWCVTLSAAVLCLAACSTNRAYTVSTPQRDVHAVEWSDADKAKPVAVHTLRVADSASYHIMRLRDAEKPHLHATHGLVVTVLRGKVRMHLGDRVFMTHPGDVIDIPRGVPHWAENISDGPSEAFVVFTPAFDGKDIVLVDEATP